MYQTVGQDTMEFVACALSKFHSIDASYKVILTQNMVHHSDVQSVSVGAILSNYQRIRVEHVVHAQQVSSTPLAYLWQRDQAELLFEMIAAGITSVLIKVAGIGLAVKHLGKKCRTPSRDCLYGLHICGEGGEYETLTLDSPLFKHRIVLDETEVVMHTDNESAPVAYLRIKRASESTDGRVEVPPLLEDSFSELKNVVENSVLEGCENISGGTYEPTNRPHRISDHPSTHYRTITCERKHSSRPISRLRNTPRRTRILESHDLRMEDVANITLLLPSLALKVFAPANKAYTEFFGVSLPSRAYGRVDLPKRMDRVIRAANTAGGHVLLSLYWLVDDVDTIHIQRACETLRVASLPRGARVEKQMLVHTGIFTVPDTDEDIRTGISPPVFICETDWRWYRYDIVIHGTECLYYLWNSGPYILSYLSTMITKSEAFDASASVSCDSPPSYNAISTSLSADSIWSSLKLWVFSFLQSKQECLSCIRAIVSSPDFAPSSVAQTVSACAATLPAATEFSKLLQQPNIEGHTALYWAIVNNRREALSAFINFIPKLSPACSSDLRLACVMLDLSEELNRCPPDEIQVQELGDGRFVACFRFRMFQKRLRITRKIGVEFVAGSRIWMLWFHLGSDGRWHAAYQLSEHNLTVLQPNSVLRIEPYKRSPDHATPEALIGVTNDSKELCMLVPGLSSSYTVPESFKKIFAISYMLDEWLMDEIDTCRHQINDHPTVGIAAKYLSLTL
ncbi:hypothetical protein BDR07DRAFT_1371140 [Suillus spraguei]|nr:hypothetical protein BDR07DRAFT_1371140 [Suillus spraguei]